MGFFKKNQSTPKVVILSVTDTVEINDSIRLKKFKGLFSTFIKETIDGWFPSKRKDLSPLGVYKIRTVDREQDHYTESVIDKETGRIIRFVDEKLSQHRTGLKT
jgi:hypothetical protein